MAVCKHACTHQGFVCGYLRVHKLHICNGHKDSAYQTAYSTEREMEMVFSFSSDWHISNGTLLVVLFFRNSLLMLVVVCMFF